MAYLSELSSALYNNQIADAQRKQQTEQQGWQNQYNQSLLDMQKQEYADKSKMYADQNKPLSEMNDLEIFNKYHDFLSQVKPEHIPAVIKIIRDRGGKLFDGSLSNIPNAGIQAPATTPALPATMPNAPMPNIEIPNATMPTNPPYMDNMPKPVSGLDSIQGLINSNSTYGTPALVDIAPNPQPAQAPAPIQQNAPAPAPITEPQPQLSDISGGSAIPADWYNPDPNDIKIQLERMKQEAIDRRALANRDLEDRKLKYLNIYKFSPYLTTREGRQIMADKFFQSGDSDMGMWLMSMDSRTGVQIDTNDRGNKAIEAGLTKSANQIVYEKARDEIKFGIDRVRNGIAQQNANTSRMRVNKSGSGGSGNAQTNASLRWLQGKIDYANRAVAALSNDKSASPDLIKQFQNEAANYQTQLDALKQQAGTGQTTQTPTAQVNFSPKKQTEVENDIRGWIAARKQKGLPTDFTYLWGVVNGKWDKGATYRAFMKVKGK